MDNRVAGAVVPNQNGQNNNDNGQQEQQHSGKEEEQQQQQQQQQQQVQEIIPCSVVNPITGNFFDLQGLIRSKNADESDYHVRGYDYGHNFTMNLCAPTFEPNKIEGVDKSENVSAYYTTGQGERYSIGQVSSTPYFRGRKLLLEYKGGSPCPDSPKSRKSALIWLACDRDLLTSIALSYVGQVHECAYFFEARTPHACAKAGSKDGGVDTLGPFGIFAVISGVMVAVYVLAVSRRRIPYVHALVNGGLGWMKVGVGLDPHQHQQKHDRT
ncbi:mannose-6-phosphate receptor binding domain-containing protein [Lipomyces japonicus]|uniref:mannose-6-phosphate receptor binding domain-containing protein n=1 Tax=Lipomyces japonicus TaxID=56871 RepID=UPI0034CE2547